MSRTVVQNLKTKSANKETHWGNEMKSRGTSCRNTRKINRGHDKLTNEDRRTQTKYAGVTRADGEQVKTKHSNAMLVIEVRVPQAKEEYVSIVCHFTFAHNPTSQMRAVK